MGVDNILKKILHKFMLMVVIVSTCLTQSLAFASSDPPTPNKAVVFLFDTSESMKTNDPQKLALDSVTGLVYSLPTYYNAGVVTYSDDVVLKVGLVANDSRTNLASAVKTISYGGYSNATAGLKSALSILKDIPNSHIVMLSDGEILLKSDTDTNIAKEVFLEQINVATENGTKVHFIALADETLIDSEIAEIAEKTNGSFHYAVGANDIQSAIDNILTKELLIKKTSLGLINTQEGVSDIQVSLLNGTSASRLLVTSTTDIVDLVVDFEAEQAVQDVGKRYAFIELKNPITDTINLHIETLYKGEVSVDVISEFDIRFDVNVEYSDTIPSSNEATHYNRTAYIELGIINNQGKPILKAFDENPVELHINEETQVVLIKNGVLTFNFEVVQNERIDISVDLSSFPFNIIKQENISINLEAPPMIEKNEMKYDPYILCGLGGLVAIVLLCILARPKTKKNVVLPIPANELSEEAVTKYSYTGKINIYITRTKKDFDFPPLTFNLFHISNSRKISLEEILKKLDVEEVFEGSNKIYFRPSANRKVIITNDSDCTIMKNREIILKGKSVELFADSKLDISFEDEVSEIVLQYKDVKEAIYS